MKWDVFLDISQDISECLKYGKNLEHNGSVWLEETEEQFSHKDADGGNKKQNNKQQRLAVGVVSVYRTETTVSIKITTII